eukprot:PhM_4_TR460/c0_g1_i1/m.42771
MANKVYVFALLSFYIVCFALAIAAVSGASWLLDERTDRDGIVSSVDDKVVARISLWEYCDWNDNCFDVEDLFNGCSDRRDGFRGVRAMMIMGIIALVADFALMVFGMRPVERANRQRQLSLGRVFIALHGATAVCFFLAFALWANVSERECHGTELRRDGFDYGWCFALTVSIDVLLVCQFFGVLISPSTYFRVDESLFAFVSRPRPKRSGDMSLHSGSAAVNMEEEPTEPTANNNAPDNYTDTTHHNNNNNASEADNAPLVAGGGGDEAVVSMAPPAATSSTADNTNNNTGDFTV